MRTKWILCIYFLFLLCFSCSTTKSTKIIRDYDNITKNEAVKELKKYDADDFNIDIIQKDGKVKAIVKLNDRVSEKEVKKKKNLLNIIIAICALFVFLYIGFKLLLKRFSPL